MNYQDEKVNVNADGITMSTDSSCAADMFLMLSPQEQDEILLLIRNALNNK